MNALATSTPMQNGSAGIGPGGDAAPGNKKPKGVIEKMYQKKSQLEHVLLRPDTYIGSVEHIKESMWIFDKESQTMIQKEIEYVPGLYKIYDEILVNAADNKQRDAKMDCIKINIDPEANEISVWNNGKGIPVVEHKDEKMYVPTLIFGHLLTSSNYNDDEKKVTGGRNGYGAKLCNIFSTKFSVETASKEYKKKFKQSWSNNMSKTTAPVVKDSNEDFTKITFSPDLAKFHMEKLDKDIVSMMSRRAYDIAAATKGVKVFLNGERIPVKSFKEYVDLFLKDKLDDAGNPLKVVHESINPRWEIAVTVSEKNFQQMSFVNSIATTKGGRHVDYIADQIIKNLVAIVNKKNKENQIKPFQVKNHLWLFVNCLIENPSFDSQTKENMTLQAKSFGSTAKPSEKFLQAAAKCGITDAVLQWAKFKAQTQLQKTSGKKQSKLKGVPKLEDANEAGTKNSIDCTLILTEGDSAKTLAVSGLGVVGRDHFGVFPLRGKLLNVREASTKQIMENAEISAIVKIVGLQYKKKYETREDLKQLRYGRLMIMTDQDQDGSHIKGLIINFIHHNWPTLLKLDFLEEFITPIIKATRKVNRHNDEVLSFFSLPEFEEWKNNTPNWNKFVIKYYKGLGTSTSAEAKEYFSNMQRHRIKFKYESNDDDSHITMAFSKKMVDARKDWLNSWMSEVKRRKELGLGEDYLYAKNTRMVTYKDFINKELVLYSNMDNERSIPSMVDGLKPGSRKVLFTCLKRNLVRELKVAQLAGSVAELSAYHHGETSLMTTIINLAQNFVGSNNINLLKPNGQFGTRLQGGKDAASPRYIFTQLGPLTRLIFHPHDDPILNYLRDDNLKIEPEWYIPIIPMVLVNGADGIGTGWMTKIPNHNPREIIQNLQRMIRGEEPKPMKPWYKNFLGEIEKLGETRFITNGEVGIVSDEKIEITELPIGTWTQSYKENVLEVFLAGGEKVATTITNYKEYNTDSTVKFQVFMTRENLKKAELDGLHKVFKLQTTLSTSSMCSFDRHGVLRQYDSATQILREFFDVRLEYYGKRKSYMSGMLEAEANKLTNQARFILEKCDGDLRIENRKKKEMIAELQRRGYPGDPVRAWKLKIDREAALEEEAVPQAAENETGDAEDAAESDPNLDYDYLLGMKMWSLTLEKKNELLKRRDEKQAELDTLKKKSPADLWQEDLDALLAKMEEIEEEEKEAALYAKPVKGAKGLKDTKKKKVLLASDSLPSPHAIRVAPKIDELLKKAEKLDQARENKGKRTKKAKDGTEDPDKAKDENEPDKEKKPKVVREKKPKKDAREKASPKKRGGRKTASSGSDEDFDGSDSDAEFNVPTKETPLRSTSRRTATARRYTFDDDEESKSSASENEPTEYFDNDAVKESDDGPMVVSSLDESADVGTSKKKPTTVHLSDSDKDDSFHLDDSDSFTKKKPASKPATTFGSTDDASDDVAVKGKTTRPKKPTKKTTKTIFDEDSSENPDDDDDDSDDYGKKKPAKKATKAPAKKKAAAEKAPKRAKEPAKKLPVTKTKTAPKKAKSGSDDSDFADLGIKKSVSKRKATPTSDSSDSELFSRKETKEANLTNDEIFDSLLESNPAPKQAATKTNPPPRQAAAKTYKKNEKRDEYSFPISEVTYDSDDSYVPETSKKNKGGTKAPAKRAVKKKKYNITSDDDSDFE